MLNITAKCERPDDPLGREIGEYLWPEYVPTSVWQSIENDPLAQRTWSALYQQRPVPDTGGEFQRSWFKWYDPDELPSNLRYYGASDYAVTENASADFTEHGVFGMDEQGDLWAVAWWSGQEATDVSIDAFLDLYERFRPEVWWDEGGTIDKAIRPAIRRRMRERRLYPYLASLPSMGDKRAKVQSFRARASIGSVHFPRGVAWAERVVDQLVGFPAARYDDAVDVCGLIGRGINLMSEARKPPEEPKAYTFQGGMRLNVGSKTIEQPTFDDAVKQRRKIRLGGP